MEKGSLAHKEAREPEEEAYQPLLNILQKKTIKNNSNIKDTDFEKNRDYNELPSQPPHNMNHRQRLIWLQQRRTEGLWAQCDDCNVWRYLPHVLDKHELPKKWYCKMNPDASLAKCSATEIPIHLHDEEDLIHSEYAVGSLVVVRMTGCPWWPAMVDDCPDTEQYYWLDGFSDIPTHYNVVFFDATDVTRAWIAPSNMRPYSINKKLLKNSLKRHNYQKRVEVAKTQADDAEKLPLAARLAKYSFIARYKGKIVTPKKINKSDVKKYQQQFKRKYNIDLPEEITDSDDDVVTKPESKEKAIVFNKKSKKIKINDSDKRIKKPLENNKTTMSSNENNPIKEMSLAVHLDCNSETNIDSILNALPETETDVYNDQQLSSSPPSGNFDY